MAKSKSCKTKMGSESRHQLSSYETMGIRIKNEIMSPVAQSNAHVVIKKNPSDLQEDWDRFVDEIETEEGVTVHHIENGVELRWLKLKSN